jgi:hypothetical protein
MSSLCVSRLTTAVALKTFSVYHNDADGIFPLLTRAQEARFVAHEEV